MVRLLRAYPAVVLLLCLAGCTFGSGSMQVNVLNPAQPLYEEGLAAYNTGDLDTAINRFTDVVHYYSHNGLADDATYMLGRCYDKKGDILDAARYYQLFVERFPNDKRAPAVKKRLEYLKSGLKDK